MELAEIFIKYDQNSWKGIQSVLFRVHMTFNYKVTRFHFLQSMLYNCFMRKVKPALCAQFFFNYSLEKIMKKTYHLLVTEAKFHVCLCIFMKIIFILYASSHMMMKILIIIIIRRHHPLPKNAWYAGLMWPWIVLLWIKTFIWTGWNRRAAVQT